MTKKEFLETLRIALTGHVSPEAVHENVSYYDTYISMQMKKGMTEEQVLEELGPPRLIARTIIESEKYAGGESPDRGEGRESEAGRMSGLRRRIVQMPGWLMLVLLVLLPILCMTVLSAVFSMILSVLGPVLVPLLVLWAVVLLWRRIR